MSSYRYRKSHLEIRRPYNRIISTMGFPIQVRRHLYIESGPNSLCPTLNSVPADRPAPFGIRTSKEDNSRGQHIFRRNVSGFRKHYDVSLPGCIYGAYNYVRYIGPFSLMWIDFDINIDNNYNHFKGWAKKGHPWASTAEQLKFGNGYLISSHILLVMRLPNSCSD